MPQHALHLLTKKEKGFLGEKAAKRYFLKKGYKVVATNWTCRWGELDLIVTDSRRKFKKLIFVEVKLRTSGKFGTGVESINYYKKRSLKRAINMYLQKYNLYNLHWRLDVIVVTIVSNSLKLTHYEAIPI